jgi:hypothetical protein
MVSVGKLPQISSLLPNLSSDSVAKAQSVSSEDVTHSVHFYREPPGKHILGVSPKGIGQGGMSLGLGQSVVVGVLSRDSGLNTN